MFVGFFPNKIGRLLGVFTNFVTLSRGKLNSWQKIGQIKSPSL